MTHRGSQCQQGRRDVEEIEEMKERRSFFACLFALLFLFVCLLALLFKIFFG